MIKKNVLHSLLALDKHDFIRKEEQLSRTGFVQRKILLEIKM
jgi:hypothetical protein